MDKTLLLQSKGRTDNDGAVGASELDRSIIEHFQNNPLKISIDELINECDWHETQMSVDKAVDNWKRVLALALLNHFYGTSYTALSAKIYQFERHPWNQNSQYFRSLVAVSHLLARMPVPDVTPHLLKGGAALIDLQEFCPWLALPSIPHHLEYGIFLCALALFIQREDLKEGVVNLARWHMNTLDCNFKPFASLFIQEANNDGCQNLVLYYLLFRGAGCLTKDAEFAFASESMKKQIEKLNVNITPLWTLIERLFSSDSQDAAIPLASPVPLSQAIYDPSTALIGYRSSRTHAVCTLHGNQTGLGTLRFDDVEIVNYGPQYLPLGDCKGFGIEGNYMTDHGERVPLLKVQPQGFILKGCARLIDQPSSSHSLFGRFRGIWIEVSQEFKYPSFDLRTSLLGLDGWEGVALTFFVKARKCHIGSKLLLPQSFDRYEGSPEEMIFEGEKGECSLKSPPTKANLHIIPLAGDHSFWGADFLAAYILHPDQRHYQWTLSSLRK